MPKDKPRILFVDDELDTVSDYMTILRLKGYQVDPAISVADAIGRLNIMKYNLIILDVMLPVMKSATDKIPKDYLELNEDERDPRQGLILLKWIRKKEKLKSIPIIIFTLNARGPDTAICSMQDGLTVYVAKPIGAREFVWEIEKFLSYQESNNMYEIDDRTL
jgi:CheY-like chemotaxis protein